MHYWTSLIHALPNTYAWGVLSEHFVGILAGGQHSALVIVVACLHSFEWVGIKGGMGNEEMGMRNGNEEWKWRNGNE